MQEENLKTIKIVNQNNPSICIVDDDNFVVDLIGRTLKIAGYTNYFIFDNGEKFVDELSENVRNPSIVISDIVLPGISGFELCSKIKALNPELPVILISGFDIEDVHLRVIESGADDFIAKPFNPLELITRIKIHLARYEKTAGSFYDRKISFSGSKTLPFIGDQIGEYIVIDTIGWGKTSFIFKASKKKTKSIYALKMLAPHTVGLKDLMARFESELRIMEAIKHPNIVSYVEKGQHNSIPYVIMEYISGLDLEEYLITRGKIPLQDAICISNGVASAIAAVHKHNIVHRDIKLKNIIFDMSSKSPKLIDFGIAKDIDAPHITCDGFIVGTPIYMAPEIFEGEEATIKSDIYSFGATMYHIFTGSPPFIGESSKELYRKHLKDPPTPMANFRNDIPYEIEELISVRCLAKKASDRPNSMEEVELELKKYLKKLSKKILIHEG